MPIKCGPQGSDKSMAVEILSSLLGKLAMLNIDDLDKVFGKFNGMLTKYLLMVINETPGAKERFGYAGKIKARITQSDLTLETKGMEAAGPISS
jgi:hypothetical protein